MRHDDARSSPADLLPNTRRTRRARVSPGMVLLGAMGVPGLAFLSSLPGWVIAQIPTVTETVRVEVSGTEAAPAITALSLVAVAAALVLRISGRMVQGLVCAVIFAAGIGIALAAWSVLEDPELAARIQVGEATGTTGTEGSFLPTVWPWVGGILGLATSAAGAVLWPLTRSWARTSKRYDRPEAAAEAVPSEATGSRHGDEIDAWDSLSRGEDPTG